MFWVQLQRPLVVFDDADIEAALPVLVNAIIQNAGQTCSAGSRLLVEQSVNVALTLAERAYFMERGEIRFSGPTADLLNRPDLLRSVFLTDVNASSVSVSEAYVATEEVALEVVGLSRSFGGNRAVDDVSFSVAAGEKAAILGSNGAGKTTLFNAITGDFPPTAGRIHFFGEDITALPPHPKRPFSTHRSCASITASACAAVSAKAVGEFFAKHPGTAPVAGPTPGATPSPVTADMRSPSHRATATSPLGEMARPSGPSPTTTLLPRSTKGAAPGAAPAGIKIPPRPKDAIGGAQFARDIAAQDHRQHLYEGHGRRDFAVLAAFQQPLEIRERRRRQCVCLPPALRQVAAERVAMLDEQIAAPGLHAAQDLFDLFVDDACGLVGVVAGVHEVFAEEHVLLALPRHRTDAIAHAPLPHHAPGP